MNYTQTKAQLVYRRIVASNSIDSIHASSSGRDGTDRGNTGFMLQADDGGEPFTCCEVQGFHEAMIAAYDPTAPIPPRLVLIQPDERASRWLEGWAEDVEQVRRTLTIFRRADDKKITTVATLAAYGDGTQTSLFVESVSLPWRRGTIVRSGVHPKSFLQGVLALVAQGAEGASSDPV